MELWEYISPSINETKNEQTQNTKELSCTLFPKASHQELLRQLLSFYTNDSYSAAFWALDQVDLFSSSFPTAAAAAAAAAKSLQLCPTLCDPIDGSPPGPAVPGILQARTLEWVAISFSNAWKWKVKVKSLSCVQPSVTPWTAAYGAPLSMGFSRQQ